jgi:predicted phage terminase large subunit-like protein
VNSKNKELIKILKCQLAKHDFWQFCILYDREFFIKRKFLKQVADAFQQIHIKEIKSLCVSMPPRAGKSYITSLFCAWCIGNKPTESVMRNTCTASLYVKFSYDVRAILKSDTFKEVFNDVRLSDDKANLSGWNTNKAKQVSYFGAGVGGTIIGFGASMVAITDDLYRGLEDALSDTINGRIMQWKEATHDSRFEKGCARIDIGTRWSINDVIGKHIEQNMYDKNIIIPALDENGNTFCDEVMTTEEYQKKKQRTESSIWQAEYMQQPVDVEGRLFNNLKYYDEIPTIDGAIAYVDVADQGKDYTACAILGVSGNEFYILDYVFNQSNTDVTIPLIASMLNKWNVSYCRVESNSMGAMFGRHLQKETKTTILQVQNTSKKETRILIQSAWIMQRINFKRPNDNESELFVANVLNYSKEGKNKNDDAPDCLAGLAMFTRSMFKAIA